MSWNIHSSIKFSPPCITLYIFPNIHFILLKKCILSWRTFRSSSMKHLIQVRKLLLLVNHISILCFINRGDESVSRNESSHHSLSWQAWINSQCNIILFASHSLGAFLPSLTHSGAQVCLYKLQLSELLLHNPLLAATGTRMHTSPGPQHAEIISRRSHLITFKLSITLRGSDSV